MTTKWWVAQDTFAGESAEGAWLTVTKGQTKPDGHPLVLLDRSEAERAAKEGVTRAALFAPQDFEEEPDAEPEPAPAPKAAPKPPPPPAPQKPATGRKGS